MSQSLPIPRGATPTGQGGNGRAAVRYHGAPAMMGRVVLDGADGDIHFGWVYNLSRTGIGLLMSGPIPAGATVAIHLRPSAAHPAHVLTARAVHCTPEPGGEWILGCELSRPLTPELLDELL